VEKLDSLFSVEIGSGCLSVVSKMSILKKMAELVNDDETPSATI